MTFRRFTQPPLMLTEVEMTEASELIRDVETICRGIYFSEGLICEMVNQDDPKVPHQITFEEPKAKGSLRLCFEGKPLIEHKIATRIMLRPALERWLDTYRAGLLHR